MHQFDTSIQWADKAIAMDPKTSEAYGLLGDAAVEMGDYDVAFGHYQKMLDIRPDLSSYNRAGYLLFVTGEIQRAIDLMQKAIAAGAPFAENTAWCRAELANMLWRTGKLAAAEQVIHTGLEQTPHNDLLLAAMGKVKAARNDYAAAIAAYEKAITISPRYNSLVALGDLYAYTGQPGKAATQFKEVKKRHHLHHKNGIHGDILRARFYADHDMQLSAALAEAQKAYQKYKNIFVADTLAWCYYKNGRYQSARNVIEKVLRFQTPDPHIWFHAGMIYAKLGEQALARKHLKQALGLNSNFHPVYATVAKDTLKQLVARSSHNSDDRGAES
ncbi:MAG: tetratricopeptide repeat protein [Desulfobacterales bacterium]